MTSRHDCPSVCIVATPQPKPDGVSLSFYCQDCGWQELIDHRRDVELLGALQAYLTGITAEHTCQAAEA